MKAEELGFVALRLIAFWYILTSLLGVVTSFSYFVASPDTRIPGTAQLLFSLVTLGLAGYVFVYTRKVSRVFFSSIDDLELKSSAKALQVVAISVVGVLFIAGALPGLATNFVKLVWALRAGAMAERETFLSSTTFFEVLYDGLSLGIGILLFARSTWLAVRWSRLQRPGDET